MINVDDWAEIRRLHFAEHLGVKTIARQLGVARNTVRTAVRGPPRPTTSARAGDRWSTRSSRPSASCCGDCPTMPATVIAERIEWTHGITILRDRVAELRPLFRPPDPCQRTCYTPGELVQFDLWQPDIAIPVGFDQAEKLWVVTAVSGYSRFMAAWMVPTRAAHDVLAGMLRVLEHRSGAPHRGVGRRRLHRPVATGQAGLHRGVPALPGDARHGGEAVQAQRPRGQGGERTGQRLLRDVVPARAELRRRGRLQRPAHHLAEEGQPPGARHHPMPCPAELHL